MNVWWFMAAGIIFIETVYIWMVTGENNQMREDIAKLMQERLDFVNETIKTHKTPSRTSTKIKKEGTGKV